MQINESNIEEYQKRLYRKISKLILKFDQIELLV
jgi:hypothetical protein